MRRWVSGYCSECGREDGYWEDVAEGPITLEQHERQERFNTAFIQAGWAGVIRQQLEDSIDFSKVVNVNTDKTVNFQIRS